MSQFNVLELPDQRLQRKTACLLLFLLNYLFCCCLFVIILTFIAELYWSVDQVLILFIWVFLLVGHILSTKTTVHIFVLISVLNVSRPVGVFVYSACIVWRMKSPDAVSMLAIFLRRMQNVVVTTRLCAKKYSPI